MKSDPFTIHKKQHKMNYLNVRPGAVKLLEEIILEKLPGISFGNGFSDMTPKAKLDKWDHIKLKNLCTAKETINRMKQILLEACYSKILPSYTLINLFYIGVICLVTKRILLNTSCFKNSYNHSLSCPCG